MGRDHLTRRTFIGGAGLSALGLYLAACGGSSSKLPPVSTAAAPTTPGATTSGGGPVAADIPGLRSAGGKPGGRLVNVFDVEGNSYDPAIGYSSTGWDAICNLLFASLYTYDADGSTPIANAAADMPEVNADRTVYTIRLREGVAFHNGRPVVAADYLYAWERVLDPANESWASSYITTIKGAQELYDGKAKTLDGVRAVDDMTLEVTLVQPDVTFIYALTQPFTAPVPKEEVSKYGKDFSTHVVGNGPYRLASYDSVGQKMVFQRFDAYHWKGLPYVDEIEFQWGIDQGVQLLKMQRGEAQIMGYGMDSTSRAKASASDAVKKLVFEQPLFASRWINLNPKTAPAFADVRVRQALNWATDREQLARLTGGEASAWGQAFPKDMLAGATRTFPGYGTDPAKAQSLLADAGVKELSFTMWISADPEPQIAQILQQQWKAIGVDVKLKKATPEAINELTLKGKIDSWISTYYAIYPTAIDVVSQYWETGGSANYTAYSSAQVDALMQQARAEEDTAARNGLLAQIEAIVGDEAAGVFVENVNWIMGVDQDRVKNFHYSGVYGTIYDRLWVEA